MSYAQQYLPGTFYEVTRRCVDRAHKFTPNYDRGGKYASSVEQLYKYATARYAEAYGIEVIAVCMMSNHVHEVLFDRRGEISMFLQERNKMLADTLKVRYGLPSSVFDKPDGPYNRLEGTTAIAEKIAYAMANPVEAGLVASPEEWPGMISAVEDLFGTSTAVKRPREYLTHVDKTNAPEVKFRVGAPPEAVELFGSVTEMATQDAGTRDEPAFPREDLREIWRARPAIDDGGGPRRREAIDRGDAGFSEGAPDRAGSGESREAPCDVPRGDGKMHFIYGYAREAYVPLPAA
ncbi:hypothetical protein OUZ56_033105 [Daphnia magna]|uniref:Transposase IS200-like domain-containing protein n=1 Tax=Daphnia magna TaxID=35525 RepID=A0ABR0BA81_9CRUS|nr:hypothetical protein OUZ56_033105 [Daphnia magna]